MNRITLTRSLSVLNATHILYFYSTEDMYIENASAFVRDGIEQGQQVILIDTAVNCDAVLEAIDDPVHRDMICFIDTLEHYQIHQDFNPTRVLNKLRAIIDPYVKNGQSVRMWGQIHMVDPQQISEELNVYERAADTVIGELGYTTVCAFNAHEIPADIQMNLMGSHEHFMTDERIVRSPLYRLESSTEMTAFPSISAQRHIESEIDLYKRKLDFVHVVSHEVRNPLTVIAAYAALLSEDETDSHRRDKLETILNYCKVIDNELSHIINTEQMLTTDTVWVKSCINVLSAVNGAIDSMSAKALTHNIKLETDVQLNGHELACANLNGMKMLFTHLLSNAIKYSSDGQLVRFIVRKHIDVLTVDVVDYGIGIAQTQLRKLFNKYERINGEPGGQGIGLFMVKRLVDHFRGSIEVASQLGEGSVFTIRLPITERLKSCTTNISSTR